MHNASFTQRFQLVEEVRNIYICAYIDRSLSLSKNCTIGQMGLTQFVVDKVLREENSGYVVSDGLWRMEASFQEYFEIYINVHHAKLKKRVFWVNMWKIKNLRCVVGTLKLWISHREREIGNKNMLESRTRSGGQGPLS